MVTKYVQEDAIRAYRVIIEGNTNGIERDHFIAFFNWLIMEKWSLSGLKRIKDKAWKEQPR